MLTSLPPGEALASADPVRCRAPRHRAVTALVSTFWSTTVTGGVPVVRVLPDAAVDLVVSDGRVTVAGPDTRPCLERLVSGPVLGVQLRPEAVPTVLGVPASALLNARVDITELWGDTGRALVGAVGEARSAVEITGLLEQALLPRLATAPLVPAVGVLRQRLAAGLTVDTRRSGVSERQLRRWCVAAYGYGPQLLKRVMRFQVAMEWLRSSEAWPLADVAVAAGYVDQSHLARDVGEFSGMTPAGLRVALGGPVPSRVASVGSPA